MALGTNPDWNFPRRRCDDCNKSYKPTRPNSRYCSTVCRDAHNRHGGAYRKLKGEMQKMVRQMEVRLEAKLDEYVDLAVRNALAASTPDQRRELAKAISQSLSPCNPPR